MDFNAGGLELNQSTEVQEKTKNPLLKIKIEKLVANISVGQSGEQLQRAFKVLEQLTGQRPCQRTAKKTIRNFGIRKGEPISCVCTLRGEKAVSFLKRALETVGNKLTSSQFDKQGNFSFGIKEHIEIPGVKYIPDLGIFGMDICVSLEKPGYRVKRRRRLKSKVGKRQRTKPEESIDYVRSILGVNILGDENNV